MDIFLLNSSQNTTLFFKNSCYSYQYGSKLLFLNANFLGICLEIFSLTPIKRIFMIAIDINSKLTDLDIKLLINSFKHAPEMPLSYHLETLKIAQKLQGGKQL